MICGYARVSTDAQDLTGQLAQLRAGGCEKVFREKITGATADARRAPDKPITVGTLAGVEVGPNQIANNAEDSVA